MKNMYLGEIISIGTALSLTITVICFEYSGRIVGSLSVNVIRILFAFFFLSITLYITKGFIIPTNATSYAWLMLVLSGFIGFVIGDIFLFQSFVDVGGRTSLLIYSSVPIITSILSYFIFDEVLSYIKILGITIILCSIIVVILSKKNNAIYPNVLKGIIFAFIGAFAQAIGMIFSKLGMGYSLSAFSATQIRLIAAIIGFTIYVLITGKRKRVVSAFSHKKAIIIILLGSFFGPFLGVSSSLLAMKYTGIGVSTTIAQLNIIMIIPVSVILFKDKVSFKEVIASLTAIGGVLLLFL